MMLFKTNCNQNAQEHRETSVFRAFFNESNPLPFSAQLTSMKIPVTLFKKN